MDGVPGVGQCIAGEVFRVDDSTLAAMDILEGVRSGYYYKKTVKVILDSGDSARTVAEDVEVSSCTAYFFKPCQELLALPLHGTYDDELHSLYQPGPLKNEIVELCQRDYGPGSRHIAGPWLAKGGQ